MDVGTVINQYQVIEHIGRGGMAHVWSARDQTLGRMVAIKTIAPNLATDNLDPVQLFEQEARTIANLEHPHILPIYGFGDFEGKLYIIMRFVTGGSLEERLRRGPMPFDELVRTARSVADALHHAHTHDIIHLDLKPPNILMDGNGSPYLADFGLATVLDPGGRARNPGSGTLLYMAPEQLTSETLDRRADVYSFSLVLFHMLTGRLPFDANFPLALRQLQFGDLLPDASNLNADIPAALNSILRRGTAPDPDNRYEDVATLIADVSEVLGVTSSAVKDGTSETSTVGVSSTTVLADMITMLDSGQVEIDEAKSIYEKARLAWANGSGRFLLSVTHYMVMSDYYVQARHHGISYDQPGAQMLLRGALEYDYHIEYWWRVLDNDSRRWVCLHAIRSENAPARQRAFHRLESLPDEDPPVIPNQVAQALSIDNDQQAQLAALQVLGTRVRLLKDNVRFEVQTRYQGTLLNTIVREGIQRETHYEWQPVVYTPDIDMLVAETALDRRDPVVADAAARAIGRMRSIHAVKALVREWQARQPGTLRALALVLDEVPALPSEIAFQPRLLAWLVNTWRRLTESPMALVWAGAFALIGGWLGAGQHVYRLFRFQVGVLVQLHIKETLANGLLFGFLTALLTVGAMTLPKRLQGFWPWWTRLIWSATAGYFLSVSLWMAYVWLFLQLDPPPLDIQLLTGMGTAVGLVLPVVFRMRGWLAFLITTVGTFTPMLIGSYNWLLPQQGEAPLFGMSPFSWFVAFNTIGETWTIGLPFVMLFALGVHFPAIVQDVRDLLAFLREQPDDVQPGAQANDARMDVQTKILDNADYAPLTVQLDNVKGAQEMPGLSEDDTETRKIDTDALQNPDARTEEFEMGQVGGKGDDGPETDWDALMSPLEDARTEEFEMGQVGGKGDDDAWDTITRQLDELDDNKDDDKKDT